MPSSVEEWLRLNGSDSGGRSGSGQSVATSPQPPQPPQPLPSAPTSASATNYPSLPNASTENDWNSQQQGTNKLYRNSKQPVSTPAARSVAGAAADTVSQSSIKFHGKARKKEDDDDDPFANAFSKKNKKKKQQDSKKNGTSVASDAMGASDAMDAVVQAARIVESGQTKVKLHGLVVAKNLNGRVGWRGVYSPAKGRFLIHFDNNKPEPLWIKEQNMTLVESSGGAGETKRHYPTVSTHNKKNGDDWETASFTAGSSGEKNKRKKKKKKNKKKSLGGGGFSVSEKGARAKR